jgi:hypothetical protein
VDGSTLRVDVENGELAVAIELPAGAPEGAEAPEDEPVTASA